MTTTTPSRRFALQPTQGPARLCQPFRGSLLTRLALCVSLCFSFGGAEPSRAQACEGETLAVVDLNGDFAPDDGEAPFPTPSIEELATFLLGPGVTYVPDSASITGDPRAFGLFTGGAEAIGLAQGVVIGTGRSLGVIGPNESSDWTWGDDGFSGFGTPGDDDLTALAGANTFDAAILEFEFQVGEGASEIEFQYVFGSEEYNEFVYDVNDVFAFWINDDNCALTSEGDPVAINTINNGVCGGGAASNPALYINNDPFLVDSTCQVVPTEDLRCTEMDGLTVVLTCRAAVVPGTNTARLAIADASDEILDSWVLIGAGSFQVELCGNGILDPGEECDEGEENGEGGSCSAACRVNPGFEEPGITLVKTILSGSPFVGAGEVIEYELVATNTGNVLLEAVEIDDPSAEPLDCDPAAPASLMPGQQLVCVGSYTTDADDVAAGEHINLASVRATMRDSETEVLDDAFAAASFDDQEQVSSIVEIPTATLPGLLAFALFLAWLAWTAIGSAARP